MLVISSIKIIEFNSITRLINEQIQLIVAINITTQELQVKWLMIKKIGLIFFEFI
jgi:hypothetical protein